MFLWIKNFITVNDYDRKKNDIARKIVKRQSRGNVSIQNGNGDTITEEIIRERGKKADQSLERLVKIFPLPNASQSS